VNFSGDWVIRPDSAVGPERLQSAVGKAAADDPNIIPLPPDNRRAMPQRQPSRTRGGLVQVFLQSGRNLKVTQTAHGIFISFDRSVVEEFRFGENREISVGEIVAQRVSGWEGNRYVVETLDRKGMKLTEKLYLSDDGETLHRDIALRDNKNRDVTFQQSFARNLDSP
jgi:hypothetical protein